jgi:peptidoglycan hydrolase-like protein with peptidoglycan-binding domain
MAVTRLPLLVLCDLGACSSDISVSKHAEPVARPSAAQVELQAATRDSSTSRDDIRKVQEMLAREGYHPGTTDGVWGPATASALKLYQRHHDLPQTGQLDADTRRRLDL